MGPSNPRPGVIDYRVMWIHQRTGENTAISVPAWAYVLGVLAAVGLASQFVQAAWGNPVVLAVLATLAAIGALIWWLRRGVTKNEREHQRLAALERAEFERNAWAAAEAARQADLERLRGKYRSGPDQDR
jgi:cyanate permease